MQVREIDLSARSKGRGYMSYSQSVLMPVQVSTYLMFLKSRTLLLAPMVNLTRVRVTRIKLIVMPLKIHGACASPCRVIGVVPASN